MALRASLSSLLLIAVIGSASCQREEGGGSSTSKGAAVSATAAPGAPVLELFVMSQCPYGVQVVDAAAAAKKQLGSAMDVKIQYIGDGTPGQLTSMHGPDEVKGNLAQICALKQAPDRALGMITCQNKNMQAVASNWRDCAKEVGIDVDALAKCVDGEEGQKLLAASYDEAKKRGASGSPTMFLAGKPYEGGRKPRDFVRAVCGATDKNKPAACTSMPEPPKVSAVFLSDARCKECDIRGLEPRVKAELGGLVVEHVDYGTDRGKELYKQLVAAEAGFKHLPAVLLGPEVEKDTDGYPALQRFLRPVGDYRELRLGGSWDPTAEICDNGGTDDDGNGKSDCDDTACKNFKGCRPAKQKKLDLFVMSQCPYGAQAMIAAKDFMDHMKSGVELDVHFIGNNQNGQLSSMHGQSEVDEDVRERCAAERYGKDYQYLKYLACRSKDYKNDKWQGCATESGMDPNAIQQCFDKEGKTLLAQSFAFAESLGISASPTFLVNNQRDFNAITAAGIQREFCKDNPSVAGCKDLIPEPQGAQAGGGQMPAGQCN